MLHLANLPQLVWSKVLLSPQGVVVPSFTKNIQACLETWQKHVMQTEKVECHCLNQGGPLLPVCGKCDRTHLWHPSKHLAKVFRFCLKQNAWNHATRCINNLTNRHILFQRLTFSCSSMSLQYYRDKTNIPLVMDTFSSYEASTFWSAHSKHQTSNVNILPSLICSDSKVKMLIHSHISKIAVNKNVSFPCLYHFIILK